VFLNSFIPSNVSADMWRLTALYGGSLFILPLRVIIVLGCRIWEDENGGSQTETVPLEMVEINTKSTNHTRQVFFFLSHFIICLVT